jgi:shikimate dehydrogenase
MQQVVRSGISAEPVSGTRSILLGLIGSPIKSSAAPAMHEAAAAALGLSAHYRLIDRPGLGPDELRALLDEVRRAGFAGVNVTFPYKQMAVKLVDELTREAAFIGAVNTIVVRAPVLVASNTDATGFVTAFRGVFGSAADRPVALIGAGGVGRAIGYALTELGARELRIFDADRTNAIKLASTLGGLLDVSVCDSVAQALAGAGVLINATPVGMLPNTDYPVPVELLHRDLWVADAVYTPLWTPLLRAAREQGARVMTGRELCVAQAVDAFRLFTGRAPSRDVIAKTFDAAIARRNEPRDIEPTTKPSGRT